MKAAQKTYITIPFLKEAITLRKESRPHKIALRILRNLSDIVIDIDLNDFKEEAKKNPIYMELIKRENKTVRCKKNWRNDIDFSKVADELFLVDADYLPAYKQIMEKNGCLIVSLNDINVLVKLNDRRGYVFIVPEKQRDIDTPEIYHNTWADAIKTCPLMPINSLIISDNYIFANFKERKEYSLLPLLDAILPQKLDTSFHIAIFTHIEKAVSKNEAEDLISQLKKRYEHLDLKITIVSHTKKMTTHDRELLSNYHLILPGHGFSVVEEEGASEITKGSIEPVFYGIENSPEIFLSPKYHHSQIIKWLRPLFLGKEGMCATSYIIGDKVHRMLM